MPGTVLFYISYVMLWVLIVFHTFILLETVRRIATGQISNSASVPLGESDLLETGTLAPSFEALEVTTRQVIRSESFRGESVILAFVAPGCTVCEETAEELIDFHHRSKIRTVAVCQGTSSACAKLASRSFSDIQVLSDQENVIAKGFRVKRTPVTVLLDGEGRVQRYGAPRSVTKLDLNEWFGVNDDMLQRSQIPTH